MKISTSAFDPAEYLRDVEDVTAYLMEALQTQDHAFFEEALKVAIRAMTSASFRRHMRGPSSAQPEWAGLEQPRSQYTSPAQQVAVIARSGAGQRILPGETLGQAGPNAAWAA